METSNNGDKLDAESKEILFRETMEEYQSLIDSLGRVPSSHPIHKKVQNAFVKLVGSSRKLNY